MLSALLSSILGDSVSAQLAPPVPSYEELHAVAQSVLLPPDYSDGVAVHVLQAVNKKFALFHKCVWTTASCALCAQTLRHEKKYSPPPQPPPHRLSSRLR
jgi:hypothetical protein